MISIDLLERAVAAALPGKEAAARNEALRAMAECARRPPVSGPTTEHALRPLGASSVAPADGAARGLCARRGMRSPRRYVEPGGCGREV